MRRIFWDTMVHAYWLEDHKVYGSRVEHIHNVMMQRGDALCSSLFILSELLVGPVKRGDTVAVGMIEMFFDSGAVTMLPYTRPAVSLFARLRALHGRAGGFYRSPV